jgi:methionine synthase II (cobalamin-independent)
VSLGIAYFFFDGRDSQKELQLHDKLIRILISQLSDTRHGGATENLADLYKRCGEVQQPSDEQLQNVLRDILDRFSQAYIIIDALDECTDREKTLNWVNKLISDTNRKAANLHIVVTSRPERDIHEVFAALDPHAVDVGEANTKDIAEYLKLQVESKFTKYDENTRAKIMSELKDHAEGSYVYLVLPSVQFWLMLL